MDQNSFVEGQSQPSVSTTPTSSPQSGGVQQTAPTQTEKMLSQTEVNSIVGRTRAEAEERGRQRALQEQSTSQNSAPKPIGGITESDMRRIAAEESQKKNEEFIQHVNQQYHQEQATKTLNELNAKLQTAKEKYSDFEEKVAPYYNNTNIGAFGLANQFDNTADLVYEFSNRPSVLYEINAAFATGGQTAAFKAMSNLSNSIKLNQAASTVKTPNEPLSQIKSSPVGSDDGSMSVSDYIAKFKKR